MNYKYQIGQKLYDPMLPHEYEVIDYMTLENGVSKGYVLITTQPERDYFHIDYWHCLYVEREFKPLTKLSKILE